MIKKLLDKGCFKNCLDVVEVDEGYLPLRFSEYQMSVYSRIERFGLRSHCPAGISIDMETDSAEIIVKYKIDKGKSRDWIYFDFYINNIHMRSIGNKPIDSECEEISFQIPENNNNMNRITIYLPQNVSIIIKDIVLTEGSKIRTAPKHTKNLLCLGDSITQGMDALKPSNTYPVQLSRYLEMNLINQGVGGYYYDAHSIDAQESYNPDIITVAYGTNDWGRTNSIKEFRLNCKNYIDKLTQVYNNSMIYVITPLWRRNLEEEKQTGTLYDISAAIVQVCKEYRNVNIINGLELIPHMDEYYADGLHPTDEGFLHLTVNLLKNITKTSH